MDDSTTNTFPRVTDMTLAQVGEVIFLVAPAEQGEAWTVNTWWGGEDVHRDAPAGEATAPTIDQAMTAALKDMTEDATEEEPDMDGPLGGPR
jgi:hypothetical protein